MWAILKSEWTKFHSQPLCLLGLLGMMLITPAVFTLMVTNAPGEQIDIVSFGFRALMLGQIGVVIMVASYWGQEYENRTLRTTFLSISSRYQLFLAKLMLLSILTLSAGMIALALIWFLGTTFYHNSSLSFSVTSGEIRSAMLALISWLQIAWIVSGLTIVSKSKIVAISIMFPLFLGLSQMLFLVTPLAKFLPDLATINLFFTVEMAEFLSVGNGLFVQLAWSVLFTGAAVILTIKRDVA